MTEKERIENYLQMSIDYLETLKSMQEKCMEAIREFDSDFYVIEFYPTNISKNYMQCHNVFEAARVLELPVDVKQNSKPDEYPYTAYMEYKGYVFYSLHTQDDIDTEGYYGVV
jgi:hypothetical protein